MTGCFENKSANNISAESENPIDTINYLDFKFTKVIAFATVNPFDDPTQMYRSSTNKMDLSKFGDTISRTLDNSQIDLLSKMLSGKLNRDTLPDPADCHNPRHNIVFLNESESVVQYISVCFECSTVRSSKTQKASFKNFENFFNSIGLKVFYYPEYHKQYYDSINKLRPNKKGLQSKAIVKFTPLTEKAGK